MQFPPQPHTHKGARVIPRGRPGHLSDARNSTPPDAFGLSHPTPASGTKSWDLSGRDISTAKRPAVAILWPIALTTHPQAPGHREPASDTTSPPPQSTPDFSACEASDDEVGSFPTKRTAGAYVEVPRDRTRDFSPPRRRPAEISRSDRSQDFRIRREASGQEKRRRDASGCDTSARRRPAVAKLWPVTHKTYPQAPRRQKRAPDTTSPSPLITPDFSTCRGGDGEIRSLPPKRTAVPYIEIPRAYARVFNPHVTARRRYRDPTDPRTFANVGSGKEASGCVGLRYLDGEETGGPENLWQTTMGLGVGAGQSIGRSGCPPHRRHRNRSLGEERNQGRTREGDERKADGRGYGDGVRRINWRQMETKSKVRAESNLFFQKSYVTITDIDGVKCTEKR